jgi:hypothetical protein
VVSVVVEVEVVVSSPVLEVPGSMPWVVPLLEEVSVVVLVPVVVVLSLVAESLPDEEAAVVVGRSPVVVVGSSPVVVVAASPVLVAPLVATASSPQAARSGSVRSRARRVMGAR